MSHTEDNLLLIEDNPADANLVREALADTRFGPFQIEWVKNLSDGLERPRKEGIGVVFADLFLPEGRGIETLDRLLLAAPQVLIVVLCGLDQFLKVVKTIDNFWLAIVKLPTVAK